MLIWLKIPMYYLNILLLILLNVSFSNSCMQMCLICSNTIRRPVRFLTDRGIGLSPCFQVEGHVENTAGKHEANNGQAGRWCAGHCYTNLKLEYLGRSEMKSKMDVYSTKIEIKRNCLQNSGSIKESDTQKCNWKSTDNNFIAKCIHYCDSFYCNTNNAYTAFIKYKKELFVPVCRQCEIYNLKKETRNTNCLKSGNIGATVICFGQCFIFKHVDLNEKIHVKRKCVTQYNNYRLYEKSGNVILNGQWSYYACDAILYNTCNSNNEYITNFFKKDTQFKNVELGKFGNNHICLVCSSVRDSNASNTDCDNGIIGTLFEIVQCNTKCMSYMYFIRDKVHTVRGCEWYSRLQVDSDLDGMAREVDERYNDNPMCAGCTDEYVEQKRGVVYAHYQKEFVADTLKTCQIICNIMGREKCVAFTFDNNLCYITKDYTLSATNADDVKLDKISYALNKGPRQCTFYCLKSCDPIEKVCNAENGADLREYWIDYYSSDPNNLTEYNRENALPSPYIILLGEDHKMGQYDMKSIKMMKNLDTYNEDNFIVEKDTVISRTPSLEDPQPIEVNIDRKSSGAKEEIEIKDSINQDTLEDESNNENKKIELDPVIDSNEIRKSKLFDELNSKVESSKWMIQNSDLSRTSPYSGGASEYIEADVPNIGPQLVQLRNKTTRLSKKDYLANVKTILEAKSKFKKIKKNRITTGQILKNKARTVFGYVMKGGRKFDLLWRRNFIHTIKPYRYWIFLTGTVLFLVDKFMSYYFYLFGDDLPLIPIKSGKTKININYAQEYYKTTIAPEKPPKNVSIGLNIIKIPINNRTINGKNKIQMFDKLRKKKNDEFSNLTSKLIVVAIILTGIGYVLLTYPC